MRVSTVRVDDADDVVDGIAIDGNAREGLSAQQLNEFLDRGIDRYGDHFRTRLHGLANGFAAELDHRLDEVAVAGLDDAFFLTRFNKSIDGFGRALGLLFGLLLGQRCHRLQEAQDERDGQDDVDHDPQQGHPAHQPLAIGAREEHEGQEAVENDDDEDEAEGGLKNFLDAPGLVAENGEADHHGDGGHGELYQDGHRERGSGAADAQFGLDLLLEGVDVVLKFAGEKFADLGIEAVDVGDQGQHSDHGEERNGDGVVAHEVAHREPRRAGVPRERPVGFLRAPRGVAETRLEFESAMPLLSIRATGRASFLRRSCSRRAISPRSDSWS
jgi:hypothetical protein